MSTEALERRRRCDELRRQGRLHEARECYEAALRLAPGDADGLNNLGVVLYALGHIERALARFRDALAADPAFPEAYVNLGNGLHAQGDFDAALEAYRAALRVDPKHVLAHNNLAVVYHDLGRMDEANASDDEVLRLHPNDGTRIKRAIRLPVVARSRQQIAAMRDALRQSLVALLGRELHLDDPLSQVGQTTFWLPYHGLNDRDLHGLLAQVYLRACPSLAQAAPHCASGRALRARRRVGFLSRYFFDHSVGTCYARLIDRLAAEGSMDITVITVGAPTNEQLRRTFPSVRSHVAVPLSLDAARTRVAALELDVLAFTDIGMDPLSYFLAFSRLAPVQCALLGHPVTTGIANVDYFLSSTLVEPEGADEHYSESLIRLEALPAYVARPEIPVSPKDRRALGLPTDRRLYVCPAMLQKLHPDFDRAIADILRRDSGGEVVLFQDSRYPHWHRMVLERFAITMPDAVARVRFLPWLSREDLVSTLLCADAVLDTFHFGASTTSLIVLATGVPIITMPGLFARARMTLAYYRRIGVMDAVANTPGEFVDLATRIARDRPFRDDLRGRILARCNALYEDARLPAELGRALSTLPPLQRSTSF